MAHKSKIHETLAKAAKQLELNGYSQSIRASNNDALAVFTKIEGENIIQAKCVGYKGKVKVVYSSETFDSNATD